MKRTMVLLFFLAGIPFSTGPALPQAREIRGFARLKTLVGDWEGKNAKGEAIHATFKLVASDSALLETDTFADENTMVTVYHADHDLLALTHFCEANNQPRMAADPSVGDAKQLDFAFVGATNLHSPEIGHMHHLHLRFDDNDHFTAIWTWRHNDQETPETFHFTRKK